MATVLSRNLPLPPNPYSAVNNLEWHNAYSCCLNIENGTRIQIMQARILGYAMIEAPIDEGRTNVSQDILGCNDDSEKLRGLADLYLSQSIRLFKQSRGSAPTPSEHPNRPSFADEVYRIKCLLEDPPTDHETAKRWALTRDRFRCLCSGIVDTFYYKRMNPSQQASIHNTATTQAAHIIPPLTNQNVDTKQDDHSKINYGDTVWNIVRSFSGISVLEELNGTDVHRTSNILTLRSELYNHFNNLDLWFEPVPNMVDTYDICSSVPILLPQRRVTFATTTGISLPDPRYLKLHAAVCRIAHLSAAAEYIESYERDVESMMALARDGSSADVLSFALQRAN